MPESLALQPTGNWTTSRKTRESAAPANSHTYAGQENGQHAGKQRLFRNNKGLKDAWLKELWVPVGSRLVVPCRQRCVTNWEGWLASERSSCGAYMSAESALLASSCLWMCRDGSVRIKLALEGPRWHSHLGGPHAILAICVVGRIVRRVLRGVEFPGCVRRCLCLCVHRCRSLCLCRCLCRCRSHSPVLRGSVLCGSVPAWAGGLQDF